MHAGMWNGEVGSGELEVAVEENVDVNGAIGIKGKGAARGGGCLLLPSEFAFNGLRGAEELLRSEGGLQEDNGVEVRMWGVVPPGLGLDNGGSANKATYPTGE